jgi:hypothetical protein
MDWFALGVVADARGYNNRAGECVNTLLKALRDNLKKHCADETIKDTIASQWTTGVIKHEMVTEKQQRYCGAVIQDGVLVMQSNEKSFYSNVAEMGDARLVASLKVEDGSGLSLKAAVNVKSTQEERDALLTEIQDLVGVPAVTLDVDFASIAKVRCVRLCEEFCFFVKQKFVFLVIRWATPRGTTIVAVRW